MKITKRSIDSLTFSQGGGTQYHWDSDLVGFGVRVYASGKKSYVITYRSNNRQRFYVFARVGEVTPHQARTEAMELLAKTRRGSDPAADRQERRVAPTMNELADRYLRQHAKPHKKPSGYKNDERIFRLHVLPKLGMRQVADVSRDDLFELHAQMADTPHQANRTLSLLSKAFNLSEIWGWRPDGSNPCRLVQRYQEVSRERFLSQEELRRLLAVLAEAESQDSEPLAAIHAIRLIIFTGCRKGEIKELRWRDVDFERRCLFLPDSKTGKKTVYLNRVALQELENIERDTDNPFVIPGSKPNSHLVGLSRIWYRLRTRAELDDVRIHDLRHTFASIGCSLGLSLPMIGRLLGHKSTSTTQRYAHLASKPMEEATNRVGEAIFEALTASTAS